MKTTHTFDREEVMAYLDGELAPSRAAAVRQHLESCAECRALSGDLRAVSARLADWTVEPSPVTLASLAGRTWAVSGPQEKRRLTLRVYGWVSRRSVFGLPRWVLVGVPALAVLLLAIVVPRTTTRMRSRPSPIETSSVESNVREALRSTTAQTPSASPRAVVSDQRMRGQGQQQAEALLTLSLAQQRAAGPMIVRTASMTLSTDSFDTMRPAIEGLVTAHAGRIAALSVAGEPGSGRALHATLRIPVTRLDAALAALRQLGKVTAESQASEEVTDSYRDLTVRIGNSKREEQRLVEVLAKRTGDLADVLAVEQALARVRGDVEQMEAQERALKGRVDDSTVTLEVQENRRADLALGPLQIPARFRNALVDGLTSAAEGVIGVALGLLSAAPTLVLWVIVLWWPVRRVWKIVRAAGQGALP